MMDIEKVREREQAKDQLREARATVLIKMRAAWHRWSIFWNSLHYGFGVLGLVLSTTLATKPKFLPQGDDFYGALAYVLAISTGLFTIFSPGDKGNRLRRAWIVLNGALVRYLVRRGDIDDVVKAYQEGEAIIHDAPQPASLAPGIGPVTPSSPNG